MSPRLLVWSLFAVLLVYLSQNSVRSETEQSCKSSSKTFPISRIRNCTVSNSSINPDHRFIVNPDTNPIKIHLTWYDYRCSDRKTVATECPGYAGMKLTFKCNISGSHVYSVQENKQMSKAYFSVLKPADAGEYQCRRSSDNEILSTYNITVLTEVGLGLDSNYCGSELHYNSTYNCCEINNAIWKVMKSDQIVSPYFYAFGTSNVSLQHHWITPPEHHSPTDVGLFLSKPINISSTYFEIGVTNIPKRIEGIPAIMTVISVSDEFISHSICARIKFKVIQDLATNDTLPLNVSTAEGNNATFECELGTYNPNNFDELFIFNYKHASQDAAWNRSCSVGRVLAGDCWVNEESSDDNYVLSLTVLQNESGFKFFRFTFQVLNVSVEQNNSFFSCSILSGDQIQWLHSAHLNVSLASHLTSHLTETESLHRNTHTTAIAVSVVTLLLLVSVGALALTGGIMLVKKKCRKRKMRMISDQVPLTSPNGAHPNICDSEANTPADMENELRNSRAPAIQILGYGNAGLNGGMVVRQSMLASSDQGYQSSSHSSEDLSIGCQLKQMVYNERRTPPNTLGLPGMTINNNSSSVSQLTQSDPDLSNGPTHYYNLESEGSGFLLQEKCIVYISYTDRMAGWVREHLKPLIESWHHSEVMLHEDDMIPGFTIPGERQRLILEAHKVVLVVSRDYSESPWCLYELQHAIQQEPALCRGRIIPILVDGCENVPAIVRGVVPLMQTDRNFSARLKRNIMGTNQFSNIKLF